MKKIILVLLLTPIISYSQYTDNSKNYVCVEFLDHKTGTSGVGYARSILKAPNTDFFYRIWDLHSVKYSLYKSKKIPD